MSETWSTTTIERALFPETNQYMYTLKTETSFLIDKERDSVIPNGYIAHVLANALKEYADGPVISTDAYIGVVKAR